MNPDKPIILANVRQALEEDVGSGDVTAELISPDQMVSALIKTREPMFLCGQPWVNAVFSEVDAAIKLDWQIQEGVWVNEPRILCKLQGAARSILTAERCALNFLQTLSATATQVHQYTQKLIGTSTRLLDTRKTLPGLRYAQKYAVSCAGGVNHRMGLYDAFLIKENHIKACGSIKKAIQSAKEANLGLLIEVEVETLTELQEALQANPDRIMLDNFSLAMLKEAVFMAKDYACPLEASGGIDLNSIRGVAETGVDYVSVGAVTKSIRAIDLSLLIIEE